ncbi:MAG: GUN4 domain-containing protein [Phormidium sp. PBR-2020]|nr:MAG: GUN4 domain-containing protein [Phormidium sp. PBR-2020]
MKPSIYTLEGVVIENKYHLQELLGAGGFGAVYLSDEVVRDRLLRQVAVKIFDNNDNRQLIELIEATRLDHPHLIRSHTAGEWLFHHKNEEIERLYLVMEQAEYSLQERLEKGELSQSQIQKMICEVASALDYLHRHHKVHCDLKPGNILWVNGCWKLSDFGLIHDLGNRSYAKTVNLIGSYAYMPPESYQGEIRPAWDVWSLGILLQEMLTGTHPFLATTIPQLMNQVMTQEPEFPEEVSGEFLTILKGCFAKNPKERWTAQQVLDAVQPRSSSFGYTLSSIADLDLSSERPGINYYKLRDLLAAKRWGDADRETAERMWEVMGRQEEKWLDESIDIEKFPCKDLKIIDTLWVHYSQGKFGFSVQKKIWEACGSPLSYNDDWERFGERVGWREGGEWMSYKDVYYSPKKASLPVSWVEGDRYDGWRFGRFACIHGFTCMYYIRNEL